MSTIRETALAAVGGRIPRGTGGKAQAVLDALVKREQDMYEELAKAADGEGLGVEMEGLLTRLGMHAPAVANASNEDGLAARISALEAKVDRAIADVTARLRRR